MLGFQLRVAESWFTIRFVFPQVMQLTAIQLRAL